MVIEGKEEPNPLVKFEDPSPGNQRDNLTLSCEVFFYVFAEICIGTGKVNKANDAFNSLMHI